MKNEFLLTERILGAEKKNKTIHGSSAAELFQPQDGGSLGWGGNILTLFLVRLHDDCTKTVIAQDILPG